MQFYAEHDKTRSKMLFCILLTSVFLAICGIGIYKYSRFGKFIRNARVINKLGGPPVLGTVTQIGMKQAEIYESIRYLSRTYGPTYRVWIGVIPSINTLSPEDIKVLLSTTKHNAKGPIYQLSYNWLRTGLLTSTGKKWHQRRKLLTPSFHFSILTHYVDVFNKHTLLLTKVLEEVGKDGVDVTPIISDYTLYTVCETIMGINASDQQASLKDYKDCIKRFGEICMERLLNPWLLINPVFEMTEKGKENSKICDYLHAFSSAAIEKRKRLYEDRIIENQDSDVSNNRSDSKKRQTILLDKLLSEKLDYTGIQEEIDTFVFEGHDTTAISLCFSLMLLACNRECQDKVYEEIQQVLVDANESPTHSDLGKMKYLERCIKESLRLYPSVPYISRICSGMTTCEGYKIPEGLLVNILIHDMHRRPDLYPNPERFDPDRFLPENEAKRHPFAYIPFSAGPRNCIGQKFAMFEMKCCLVAILKNFILEPLDTPDTVRLFPDMILRTLDGIKVKFVPRSE